jgi:hypothetical protein
MKVRPTGVRVLRFGKDISRPSELCLTLKIPAVERACVAMVAPDLQVRAARLAGQIGRVGSDPGRVWVLVTAGGGDQESVRGRVAAGSDISCYEGICVLRGAEGAGRDVQSQLRFFLWALADVAS